MSNRINFINDNKTTVRISTHKLLSNFISIDPWWRHSQIA